MRITKYNLPILLSFFFIFFFADYLFSQTIAKEELIFLTSEWKGERFADGRPKVPDALLERARNINIDDAWTVLKNNGYVNQFKAVGKWLKMMCP